MLRQGISAALLVLGAGACQSRPLETPDGATPVTVIRCPLSTELTVRWYGYGVPEEKHRLVPPALYQREPKDGPACARPIPDCDSPGTVTDLGDIERALAHPDVSSSWPGTGERVFTFDPAFTDVASFFVESKGRGTIVVSPNCDRTGCVLPPAGVWELQRTMLGLVDDMEGCR